MQAVELDWDFIVGCILNLIKMRVIFWTEYDGSTILQPLADMVGLPCDQVCLFGFYFRVISEVIDHE